MHLFWLLFRRRRAGRCIAGRRGLVAAAPAAMAASAFVFFSISKSPYPVYLRAQVKYEIPVAFLHTSPVRGSCMYSSPPT